MNYELGGVEKLWQTLKVCQSVELVRRVRLVGEFWIVNWAQAASLRQRGGDWWENFGL